MKILLGPARVPLFPCRFVVGRDAERGPLSAHEPRSNALPRHSTHGCHHRVDVCQSGQLGAQGPRAVPDGDRGAELQARQLVRAVPGEHFVLLLIESTLVCRTSVQVTRDRLTPDSWKGSDEVWLDVVRSWCALDLQQAEHLKSVLNPEFAGRLMNNANCKFQDVSKARR